MKQISITKTIILLLCVFFTDNALAQKYKSSSSSIHFFSNAPVEDIEATNLDGQSAIDLATGEIVFSIPIKSFTFEKSLMQEHFNENYMESDTYPKATFKGKIIDFDIGNTSLQDANAKGILKIHGIEKEISVEGQLKIGDNSMELNAKFSVKLEDHKIKIPKIVFYNIAEIIAVTISFNYEIIN